MRLFSQSPSAAKVLLMTVVLTRLRCLTLLLLSEVRSLLYWLECVQWHLYVCKTAFLTAMLTAGLIVYRNSFCPW